MSKAKTLRLLPFILLFAVGCGGVHNGRLYLWTDSRTDPKVVPVNPVAPTPGQFKPKNLVCLILEDFKGGKTLSDEQLVVINSSVFRKFLNDNCLPGAEGKPMWRVRIDKDAELTGEWKTLATPMPTAFPAMLLKNGNNVIREALPATREQIESVMNQYAGVQK